MLANTANTEGWRDKLRGVLASISSIELILQFAELILQIQFAELILQFPELILQFPELILKKEKLLEANTLAPIQVLAPLS